ncbi:nucleotidyl transferase AbiEii/AbiGii toxin family protein [Microbacterium sp.]|uniref:nucleotidyl transferase AbiEii/AbiGii toxin family protein n=1 Tax=Microbacterium sp. TaxID=51671 RepID=UPI003A943CD0
MPRQDERPTPGLLSEDDLVRVATQFGVEDEQVVRDHAISHALAAIAGLGTEAVVFFGGTALSRTLLTDVRLSEDIDLIACGDRREIGDLIEGAISRGFKTTLGAVTFTPRIRDARNSEASIMRVGDTTVQIQLLSSVGYPAWPTEVVDVAQRYADAPPARLRVLTRAAFVASKLASWTSREAPRDLYDLWALAKAGAFTADAGALFHRFGPFTKASAVSFARVPTEAEWEAALGHQCLVAVSPRDAVRVVTGALNAM